MDQRITHQPLSSWTLNSIVAALPRNTGRKYVAESCVAARLSPTHPWRKIKRSTGHGYISFRCSVEICDSLLHFWTDKSSWRWKERGREKEFLWWNWKGMIVINFTNYFSLQLDICGRWIVGKLNIRLLILVAKYNNNLILNHYYGI